ncbi:MAG: hypothetical protein JW876_07060 [Candidatus Krumholzibacteriota bacterium]|nr:hypothetical protein [Candidatus Krumholzibacteriota bacterium]
MIRRHRLPVSICLSVLLVAAVAASLRATVGGPTTIRLLGVDRATGRVFYLNDPPYGERPALRVRGFDPDAAGLPAWEEVPLWDADTAEKDLPLIRRSIEAFRRTLEPLVPFSPSRWEMAVEVLLEAAHESFCMGGTVPRYETRVVLTADGMKATFDVTGYCDRAASVLGWYRVPGDPGAAVIEFAFTGDPFETCYTTVVPVVLRAP